MTRYDIKIGMAALAIVVILGLVIGYVVGSLNAPRSQILSGEPRTPPVFDGTAAEGGGGPTVEGIPGWRDLYVNDYGDLLSDAAEARIRTQLEELYDRTGVEMTVLTIPEMITYGWSGDIEGFATTLFNAWGIGDAGRNDGVLVLVSRYNRQMRIELGAGYDASRDADMQRVIDDDFLPAFREDAYERGIERGVEATIFEIAGVYPGGWNKSATARGWDIIGRWALDRIGLLIAPVLAGLGGLFLAIRRYLRRRPRRCPDCGTMMLLAGETADDEHLDGGQRLEEYLGSVDYDVWYCPDCAHNDIHGYKAWFGSHAVCPDCGYRTLETRSEVVEAPTKKRAGSKQLDYNCEHCGYHDSEMRTIPALSESSSSGGGGGSSRSSFGGGRSSGGGASGRW